MADRLHLAMRGRGVEAWNRWRGRIRRFKLISVEFLLRERT